MRFRVLNQIHKTVQSNGSSSSPSPLSLGRILGPTKSSSIPQQIGSKCSSSIGGGRQRLALLQKRLLSDHDTIRISRSALEVELCNIASRLLLDGGVVVAAEPNLARGWDAGVDVDDDGG